MSAREWVGEEEEFFQNESGLLGEPFHLLRMKKKDVAIRIWLKLHRFIDRRIGRFGELREVIAKVGAVRRGHDDVTAGTDQLRRACQQLVWVGGVLDDFGNENAVEEFGRFEIECIPRGEMNPAVFLLHSHVIRQLASHVVPGHFVANLSKRDGKISLGGGDIENVRAGRKDLRHKAKGGAPSSLIGIGVALVADLAVDFLLVVTK